MNRCASEAQLALHAGGDLAAAEATGLRRHLGHCQRCRGLLEEFRASQVWLVSQREPPVDGQMLEQLQRRLQERLGDRRPPSLLAAWLGRAWEGARFLGQPALTLAMTTGLTAVVVAALSGMPEPTQSARVASDRVPAGPRQESRLALGAPSWLAAPSPKAELLAEPDEAARLRIELATGDPNVRIIWFASNDAPGDR